jgi:queuine/archaeosine tRNA-ribosyltransferase
VYTAQEHEKLMYFAGRNKLEELIKAVAGGADLFDKAKAESRGHTALDTVLTKVRVSRCCTGVFY